MAVDATGLGVAVDVAVSATVASLVTAATFPVLVCVTAEEVTEFRVDSSVVEVAYVDDSDAALDTNERDDESSVAKAARNASASKVDDFVVVGNELGRATSDEEPYLSYSPYDDEPYDDEYDDDELDDDPPPPLVPYFDVNSL